jgi:hypothetical protein
LNVLFTREQSTCQEDLFMCNTMKVIAEERTMMMSIRERQLKMSGMNKNELNVHACTIDYI